MSFLVNWLIFTLAVLITSYLLPGVVLSGIVAALVAALVIGFINVFVRPVILFLTLPINILTLGLFTFVVNAGLILLASAIVPGFSVNGFWWALLFSIVLAIVSSIVNLLKK